MSLEVTKAYTDPNPNQEFSCDAVVIGSGASGGILAYHLARAGLDVVVLEEGGHYEDEDFVLGELESNNHFYQERALRIALGNQPMALLQGRIVGGSPTINEGVVFRTPDEVLEKWAQEYSVEGHDPAAWKSSFDEIDRMIHTEKLTMERLNANNRLFVEACRRLGWEAEPTWRNTEECQGCGTCTMGCPIGGKKDLTKSYLPEAVKSGARIIAGCKATRLEVENGKVTRVLGEIRNPATDRTIGEFVCNAKMAFLAGGAINSAHLLLRSGIEDKHERTGKRLKLHPTTVVMAEFEQEIFGYRGDPIGSYCHEFFHDNPDGGGFVLEPIFIHPMMFSILVPGFGEEHAKRMKRLNHMALLIVQVHDDSDGTIQDGFDGRPLVKYRLGETDAKRMSAGIRRGAEIWLEAGAKEVVLPFVKPTIIRSGKDLGAVEKMGIPDMGTLVYSAHPQGGVSMSENPKVGAVDSHCRHREVSNLVVCDAGSFPTSVGFNPMMSTMALADRVGKHWGEHFQKLTL